MFVSYAHESDSGAHAEVVREIYYFLRGQGIDAQIDFIAEGQRRDWALWMADQVREADYILVIASPAYRERAQGQSDPDVGRGVQWEARLIREAFYTDQLRLQRFVPVVLPGQSVEGVPDFLAPTTNTVYRVSSFDIDGAESLLRLLTTQPAEIEPPLGPRPVLPPRSAPSVPGNTVRVAPSSGLSASVVGEGADPRTRRAFEEAFERAGGGDQLGSPTSLVAEDGPGFVQYFKGGRAEYSVICAMGGQPAVAVAGQVWEGLSRLPGWVHNGVAAAGYPLAVRDEAGRDLIDFVASSETSIDVGGGAWRRGIMRRYPDGQALWQPQPRMTMEARQAHQWPAIDDADLTVRAIAALPWQSGEQDWEITRSTRERLEALLPQAQVNNAVALLSRWRGASVTPPEWSRCAGPRAHQTGISAQYESVLLTPGQEVAARTSARLHLPIRPNSGIRVSVEFQSNLVAWRSALASQSASEQLVDLRITATEIVELWVAAWAAATMVVPRALVEDPTEVESWAPPEVELQVTANDYSFSQPATQLELAEAFDLSVFGQPDGLPRREGAVTVIAPIGLGRDERRRWATKALTALARSWTFADADESDLDRRVR